MLKRGAAGPEARVIWRAGFAGTNHHEQLVSSGTYDPFEAQPTEAEWKRRAVITWGVCSMPARSPASPWTDEGKSRDTYTASHRRSVRESSSRSAARGWPEIPGGLRPKSASHRSNSGTATAEIGPSWDIDRCPPRVGRNITDMRPMFGSGVKCGPTLLSASGRTRQEAGQSWTDFGRFWAEPGRSQPNSCKKRPTRDDDDQIRADFGDAGESLGCGHAWASRTPSSSAENTDE